MDVNERVPLMNGIVTYSWAIIGIVTQVQAFSCVNHICTVHNLNKKIFLHQFSSRRPARMTKSPSVTSLSSLWIKLHLRLIASAFCSQSCWLLLSALLSFICGNRLDKNLCQPTDTHKLQISSSNFWCIGAVGGIKCLKSFLLLVLTLSPWLRLLSSHTPHLIAGKLSSHLLMVHDCQLT